MTSSLFSPIALGGVTLQNRAVISPMCQYSAEDGSASDWHMVHLGQFALSGAGLLLIEATAVEAVGRITAGCLGLYSDANEAALACVIKVIKNVTAMPIGIQLAHAGRKGSSHLAWAGGGELLPGEGGWPTVAPSPLPYDSGRSPPQTLDRVGMDRVRDAFVAAARRADRIGLDVIEIHSAHGYLLHQFLSPLTNRREDDYGGSRDARMRFPLEVASAIRAAWPRGKALGARINAADFVEGGATLEDAVAYAAALKEIGLDYVCVSAGSLIRGQTFDAHPGYLLPYAEEVHRRTGITTMGVGLIVDPTLAEAAIASGRVDLIAMARAFLDDPRWVYHAAERLGVRLEPWPQYQGADPQRWKGAPFRPGHALAA
ncbi:NADH:flavin oxidoreductase/NADH oxidase [Labrys neptuniae]